VYNTTQGNMVIVSSSSAGAFVPAPFPPACLLIVLPYGPPNAPGPRHSLWPALSGTYAPPPLHLYHAPPLTMHRRSLCCPSTLRSRFFWLHPPYCGALPPVLLILTLSTTPLVTATRMPPLPFSSPKSHRPKAHRPPRPYSRHPNNTLATHPHLSSYKSPAGLSVLPAPRS
jgi:hypothetical protein